MTRATSPWHSAHWPISSKSPPLAALTVHDYDKRLKVLTIPQDKAGAGRKIQLPASTAVLFDAAAQGKLPGALLFHRSDGVQWVKDGYKKPFARAAAKKADRITGWQTMRRMLADAGKPDVPGLYVSRGCEYFWATVPCLARDQKREEDLDSTGPDHGADACRYGLMRLIRSAGLQEFRM